MARAADGQIADMDGSSALPRKNGELVFEDSWEGRVFGMAIALHDRHLFEWHEFRDRLIEEIATAGRAGAESTYEEIASADRAGAESTYYERWLDALERLLVEKSLVSREELGTRLADFQRGRRVDVF